MTYRSHSPRRVLAGIAALLLLSAGGVLAARGGGPNTVPNAILVFDDLEGDAIGSDGLGPYEATLENGILAVDTGRKRSFYFDFSNFVAGDPNSPLGAANSGSATLRLDLVQGTAIFSFNGPGGDYLLYTGGLQVQGVDDDGDGTADRYLVATSGDARHDLYRLKKGGRGVEPGSVHYQWQASYRMPWGIEALLD